MRSVTVWVVQGHQHCELYPTNLNHRADGQVDCSVVPHLPLHLQAALEKPPLCESTNLKDAKSSEWISKL